MTSAAPADVSDGIKPSERRTRQRFITRVRADGTTERFGATAWRVADAWLRATQSCGYAITMREMTEQWPTYGEGDPPRPMADVAQTLVRAGLLRLVHGTSNRRRYAHRDHPGVRSAPLAVEHFEAQVLEALRHAVVTHGRFVTTREVSRAMRLLGFAAVLSHAEQTRLFTLLQTLTGKAWYGRATADDPPAAVTHAVTVRITAEDPARATVHWWCPSDIDVPAPSPEQPGNAREAAVRVAETVRGLLGRPGTPTELALYVQARRATVPHDPVMDGLGEGRLGPLLQRALSCVDRASKKGRRGQPRAGLTMLRTAFTIQRHVPGRFGLAPFSDVEQTRSTLADGLLRLQPGRELAWLEALGTQPGGQSAPVQDLIQLRRVLLRRALLALADLAVWSDAITHVRHVDAVLATWSDALPPARRMDRAAMRNTRHRRTRHADALAVEAVLAWPDEAIPVSLTAWEEMRTVGNASTASHIELAPLMAAAERLGIDGPMLSKPLAGARRFPRARVGRPRPITGRHVDAPESDVDRLDAYAAVLERAGTALIGTLVADAMLIIGPILRDARVTAHLLRHHAPREAWVTRALLVAHGLLGEMPPPIWCHDPDLTEAGLLGTVLADPANGAANIRRVLPTLSVHARSLAAGALMQAEVGEWLALVG